MSRARSVTRISAYGINIEVTHPSEIAAQVLEKLPPCWEAAAIEGPTVRYRLTPEGDLWCLECFDRVDSQQEFTLTTTEVALRCLGDRLEETVAVRSPDFLFVHAAVCVYKGVAIVIPGRSMSGKTSLALALCRQGATYGSDEFAPIGKDGRVAPYPRLLSVRSQDGLSASRFAPSSLGVECANQVTPIRVFVFCKYSSRQETWLPRKLTRGQTILEVLANTVIAQSMEPFWMGVLAQATESAMSLQGERGNADQAAQEILGYLD